MSDEAQPLATIAQLLARLSFDPDDNEKKDFEASLSDLSDEARYYGSSRWTTTDKTPGVVVRLVLKAAARYARNPDGFTQSRAGDEALSWQPDREAGSAHFNAYEREQLTELAGGSGTGTGLWAVGNSPYGTRYRPDYLSELVPCEGAHTKFPYFAEEDEWILNPYVPLDTTPDNSGRGVDRITQTGPTTAVVTYTDGTTTVLNLPVGTSGPGTRSFFSGHGVPSDPYPGASVGDVYLDLDTEDLYILN